MMGAGTAQAAGAVGVANAGTNFLSNYTNMGKSSYNSGPSIGDISPYLQSNPYGGMPQIGSGW